MPDRLAHSAVGRSAFYAALDMDSFQGFMILVALLAVPLGRIGLAPSFLARHRHG